jgi:hypothetical protein
MANVKLVFSGTERSGTFEYQLCCYCNSDNEIFIEIKDDEGYSQFICLDRTTSIKLHRQLKKEISFIESDAV